MTETVTPGAVAGTVEAAPSKSHLQRALAIAVLTEGTTIINGYRSSSDADAVVNIIRTLGAEVIIVGDQITVTSTGRLPKRPTTICCEESGLAARMFSAFTAISRYEMTITGKGSLLQRPFGMVTDALSQLGKTVVSNGGMLPLGVSGHISQKQLQMDGSVSSQFLTGLLVALPMTKGNCIIHVSDLKSKEYVQLTIDTMAQFKVRVKHEDFKTFRIIGGQRSEPTALTVQGDWSGAAFMLAAGAMAGEVTVTGLDSHSSQPDRAILEVLKEMGATTRIEADRITVAQGQLRPFKFDATDCPDLFPPLAALAANSTGQCFIKGVHRLYNKESDRSASILDVLHTAGIDAHVEGDELLVTGGKARSCTVSAHRDHRIAMLGALLALNANGALRIEDAEAVNKSYPEFFIHLASLRTDKKG